jgi:hypothetical protein
VLTFSPCLSTVVGLVPALAIALLGAAAIALFHRIGEACGLVSITARRRFVFQAVWLLVLVVCGDWFIACTGVVRTHASLCIDKVSDAFAFKFPQLFAIPDLVEGAKQGQSVATGSMFASAFFLVNLVNLAPIGVRRPSRG